MLEKAKPLSGLSSLGSVFLYLFSDICFLEIDLFWGFFSSNITDVLLDLRTQPIANLFLCTQICFRELLWKA